VVGRRRVTNPASTIPAWDVNPLIYDADALPA
jgi:hypothetical protein